MQSRIGLHKRAWSSRPFYVTMFCMALAVACSVCGPILFKPTDDDKSGHRYSYGYNHNRLNIKSAPTECVQVHEAADQCAFVKEYCMDNKASLIPYLALYYCNLGNVKPAAFIMLATWLGLLFTTIGLAASDFFSINLNTIAGIMGLSESLAGVTFLAFGNGSPDLFSTFAAMGSGSAGMAVGELVGAASFITAVVAGSMALVREFKVDRQTYVRDICFFSVAVVLTGGFIADGQLHLWECCLMVGYYLVYVTTVVGWHWWSTNREARQALARALRSPAAGSPLPSAQPYRDDPVEHDPGTRGPKRVATGSTDISALELGAPRIEIEGQISDEDSTDEEQRSFAAEVTSNMRVLRPGGRRRSTLNPIRPSLLGALELRSALAHAEREHVQRARSFPTRSLSESHPNVVVDGFESGERDSFESESCPTNNHTSLDGAVLLPQVDTQPESLAMPRLFRETYRRTDSALSSASTQSRARSVSPVPSFTVGGNLAPPPISRGLGRHDQMIASAPVLPATVASSKQPLQLRIPDSGDGEGDERPTPLMPFPPYTDSPLPATPYTDVATSSNVSPSEVRNMNHYFPSYVPEQSETQTREPQKPTGVSPPRFHIPSFNVVLQTLFPTVYGWREKSIWDKFVSAISVPSVFLLVLTLPVVETEREIDTKHEERVVDPPGLGATNGLAEISTGANLTGVETEWQRYRRYTQSELPSPALISISSPRQSRPAGPSRRSSAIPGPDSVFPPNPLRKPDANEVAAAAGEGRRRAQDEEQEQDQQQQQQQQQEEEEEEEAEETLVGKGEDGLDSFTPEWNRWLVALQIFTGPQFAIFILWANWADDLEDPQETIVQMCLWTLLGSTVLLALLLLTTSVSRRPKYHYLLCFLGFLISIAWISTIAGEVVGVLKAVGVILDISESILGLTVFAAGNSIGDLVADITVARLGYPVMALSACFGGPMLNILIGIGLGGVGMMMQTAKRRKVKHPDQPPGFKPFKIRVGSMLMVSAVTLLITLLALLVAVPMNKWVLTRRIGWALIALWSVSTVVNVAMELTGVWKEIDWLAD